MAARAPRYSVVRRNEIGEFVAALDADGEGVWRVGWDEQRVKVEAMADADACLEREPETRFYVLDSQNAVVYEATPGVPCPF